MGNSKIVNSEPIYAHLPRRSGSKGGAVVRAVAPANVAWVRIPASTPYVGCLEFVVGIFDPCFERVFSGCSGFPLSLKTNTSKLQFDLERTDTVNEFLRTPKYSVGKQITNRRHYNNKKKITIKNYAIANTSQSYFSMGNV